MLTLPTTLAGLLHIRPWTDPIIDRLGFDPRSTYVERFWLATLGPSTTWLLRHIAAGLDEQPEGFDLPLPETARSLGLGGEGRNSPFMRALARCCQFEMARPLGDDVLSVRRRLPPLNRRQLHRLPPGTRQEHDLWIARRPGDGDIEQRRVVHLAMSLAQLGEDIQGIERQLLAWKFSPALIRPAALWAVEQHRRRTPAQNEGTQEPSPDSSPTPLASASSPFASSSTLTGT